MIRLIPLLFLLLITLISCKKDTDCAANWTELGPFNLLPESLEMFPYEKGIISIEYVDTLDRKIRFRIVEDTLRYVGSLFQSQCTADPDLFPVHTAREESRILDMIGHSDRLRFRIQLYAGLNRNFADQSRIADYLLIDFGLINTIDNQISWFWEEPLRLVIDPRIDPEAESNITNFYPELVLNGRTFTDVYEKITEDPDRSRRIYFNFEWGLVGYTDSAGENLYSLDQIIR